MNVGVPGIRIPGRAQIKLRHVAQAEELEEAPAEKKGGAFRSMLGLNKGSAAQEVCSAIRFISSL